MADSSPIWGFTGVFIVDCNRVYVLAKMPELEEQRVHISEVFRWMGDWAGYRIEWPCIALCGAKLPEPAMLSLGIYGRIHLATASGFSEEHVYISDQGPITHGVLRDIRNIDNNIFVTGMGRQVYRRDKSGIWLRIDQDVRIPSTDTRITGFNSIDGFDEENVYAAGWGGEIWKYNRKQWEQLTSPTNLKLQRILCVAPDSVFACGQMGILLKGKDNHWEIIDQDVTKDQFWGMTWFQEKLWLSTQDSLYSLEDDKNLRKVNFGLNGDKVTCGWLDAKDGVMWSVGGKHLLSTPDGNNWIQHFIP